MGRIGITYHDILKAIHECQGLNKAPTVDNIRDLLKTGSRSTIAKFLRDWKTQNGIEKADDAAIPAELLQLVKGLWERLKANADEHIDEHKQEADAKVSEWQQQLQQIRQENGQLKAQVHQLEETLHQQTEHVKQLNSTLHSEQQEKAILNDVSAITSRTIFIA